MICVLAFPQMKGVGSVVKREWDSTSRAKILESGIMTSQARAKPRESSTSDGTGFGSPLRLPVEPDFILGVVIGNLEWVWWSNQGTGASG